MSNVILNFKYILRDIKAHVVMLDDNLYRINSLLKKIVLGVVMKYKRFNGSVCRKKEESDFKFHLEGLKDELDNFEKYYEMLKTYFKIKEESLIKLNSIEEVIGKEEHFKREKEYIEKAEETEKEDEEVRNSRWIIKRKDEEDQ